MVLINNFVDENTVEVTDFWSNAVNLGSYQNIQFYNFDVYNIHLTSEALKVLGNESLRLADYYNLKRPYTLIQPGISFPNLFPYIYSDEVKQMYGDILGYKSAGVYGNTSKKVFNEYNPNHDRQFGMNWGEFNQDNETAAQWESAIADVIAKHGIAIGESHFTSTTTSAKWQAYLDRTEQLIKWCAANNIPIKTYSEWADVLYNQTPDPNENVFPPLNVDLDGNNIPDGYNQPKGTLIKTDGVGGDYCLSIKATGEICSIRNLGGIEKGMNDFEIWTKGASGDFIEVTFTAGTQNTTFKFPASTSVWTKYNLAQSINGTIL